jgi:hypothetical protein
VRRHFRPVVIKDLLSLFDLPIISYKILIVSF